jgi:hypothetical protein
MTRINITVLMSVMFIFYTIEAFAECRQDIRQVRFAQNGATRFKSYNCRLDDPPQTTFNVEFFTFSNETASMIVSGMAESKIKTVLGNFQIHSNDIFERFHSLVEQFGEISIARDAGSIVVDSNDKNAVQFDIGRVKKIAIVDNIGAFPPTDEILALDKHVIPDNISVYYQNGAETFDPKTKKSQTEVFATFWRYATLQDLDRYQSNVLTLNQAAQKTTGLQSTSKQFDGKITSNYKKYLGLMRELSNEEQLPKEFLLLQGSYLDDVCVGGQSWEFGIDSPSIALNVALIRNTSSRPIHVNRLKVHEGGGFTVRRQTPKPQLEAGVLDIGITLSAGQSLIVPIQISFINQLDLLSTKASIEGPTVYQRLVSKGISTRPDVYAVPDTPNFVYGPEVEVEGVAIDGRMVDLSSKLANFVDVSFGTGAGSCPHLLSWSDQDQVWINYGKVLHEANNASLAMSQHISFPGFVSRFRLEEREPEISVLKTAELILTLAGGKEIKAVPVNYHENEFPRFLFWEDEQELAFALPAEIAKEDVIASRLVIAGYYERYSNLAGFKLREALSPPNQN